MPRKAIEKLSPLTENVVKSVIAKYLTDIKKVKELDPEIKVDTKRIELLLFVVEQ